MRQNKQSGVTLIEVLVTLVILAIALTGIAAVQATSMQSASQVSYRSAAMSSAQSILDSMRARRGSDPSQSLANLQAYIGDQDSTPATTTLLGQDYQAFKRELGSGLRNRDPEFEIQVTSGRLVTVIIGWTQRNDSEEGTTAKTYTVTAYL